MEKCLIIVPHQDDELAIGGDMMIQLNKAGKHEIYVVFTTNGDWYADEAETRLEESIKALRILGVDEEHIIFLGYGDQWLGDCHIYNANPEEVLTSNAKRQETYSIPSHPEWHFCRYSQHHTYTRNHLKEDMKEVITQLMPQICVVVDFDWHADHRAASLIFEECMGEILKEKDEYTPLVLKKYVYSGLWEGRKDYYLLPKATTLCECGELTDNKVFRWIDRIRFQTAPLCNTLQLRHNRLYQASRQYKSQDGWYYALGYCNADTVYWMRNTDNLLYHSEIAVSSGNAFYLNDFKLYDCRDILKPEFETADCTWIPENDDLQKSIQIKLPKSHTITSVSMYETQDSQAHILDAEVSFDNGTVIHTGELDSHGTETVITFEPQENVKTIQVRILNATGRAGLTELEVYDHKLTVDDYQLPVEYYYENGNHKSIRKYDKVITWIGRQSILVKQIICLKVFPSRYVMKRRYHLLKRYPYLIPGFYVYRYIEIVMRKLTKGE